MVISRGWHGSGLVEYGRRSGAMVSCESQSRHHNGEPQGAPSRKDGEGKGKDDDDDMYMETTQV